MLIITELQPMISSAWRKCWKDPPSDRLSALNSLTFALNWCRLKGVTADLYTCHTASAASVRHTHTVFPKEERTDEWALVRKTFSMVASHVMTASTASSANLRSIISENDVLAEWHFRQITAERKHTVTTQYSWMSTLSVQTRRVSVFSGIFCFSPSWIWTHSGCCRCFSGFSNVQLTGETHFCLAKQLWPPVSEVPWNVRITCQDCWNFSGKKRRILHNVIQHAQKKKRWGGTQQSWIFLKRSWWCNTFTRNNLT